MRKQICTALFSIVAQLNLLAQTTVTDYPSSISFGSCIEVDASESVVELNKNFIYQWNFGDGYQTYGEKVAHCYDSHGDYKVVLSLVDPITETVFSSDYETLVSITPDIVLDINSTKDESGLYQLSAHLPEIESGNMTCYWDVNGNYYIGKAISNIALSDKDAVRLLVKFQWNKQHYTLSRSVQYTNGSLR